MARRVISDVCGLRAGLVKLVEHRLTKEQFALKKMRKRKVLADSKMFQLEAKLPMPKAFIPGQYKAEALRLTVVRS